MSFFISEVCELPEKNHVINNLNTLLITMKPDAFLIYNDSDAYSFYTFLNNRVNNATRFEQLIDVNAEYKIEAPYYEGIMGGYVEQFDYRPRFYGSHNFTAARLRKARNDFLVLSYRVAIRRNCFSLLNIRSIRFRSR